MLSPGPRKKKAVGKRKCISCTAATAGKSWSATGDGGSSVAARSSSAASTGAAQCEASRGADDTLSAGTNAAAIAATDGEDAASAKQGDTARACSACRKQLVGTADINQDWKKCGRCKQAFYCGKACQVEHWKRGGHKQACTEPMACCICLGNDGPPLPIQGGCGCREEAGCAHVVCKIEYAKHQGPG